MMIDLGGGRGYIFQKELYLYLTCSFKVSLIRFSDVKGTWVHFCMNEKTGFA